MGKKEHSEDTFNLWGFGKYIDFTNKEESVNFYSKQMFIRTNSMFKYRGLPETIPIEQLELLLQVNGFVVITNVDESEIHHNQEIYKSGVYMFSTGVGLGGEPDNLYRPTKAIIVNPAMGLSIERTINRDCVLVRNDVLLLGLKTLNSRYASLLCENDITCRIYDINSRISNIISSLDDNVAESARKYINDIISGKMGIISDNSLLEGLKTNPYEGSQDKFKGLIEYQQYLKASWLNELGLNANYNMKREALNSAETGVNEASLLPFIDNMLETRKKDFELVNKLYGLNIEIELNSSWEDIQHEIDEQTTEPLNKEQEVNSND